jgi:hypothetical protein
VTGQIEAEEADVDEEGDSAEVVDEAVEEAEEVRGRPWCGGGGWVLLMKFALTHEDTP